jgi:gamma-glutamylputrescine oxidase
LGTDLCSDRPLFGELVAKNGFPAAGGRFMINQNWWFSTLLIKQFKYCPPLNRSIKCDVLIVGGGFSGVSAAAEFLQRGFSVVLIDRNIVGGALRAAAPGF